MEALHDVVKSGKARYIGASTMCAWEFAKAQRVAAENGWTEFVSMQNHYNLLYREEEREMIPQCIDQGVGSTRGALRPWTADGTLEPRRRDEGRRAPVTIPSRTRSMASLTLLAGDRALQVVAAERGLPRADRHRMAAPPARRYVAGHRRDETSPRE